MTRFTAIAFDCAVFAALVSIIMFGLDWGMK